MWGRKRRQQAQEADVLAARAAQDHADAVIAHVDAQEPEVAQIVTRLQTRGRANHFGEALQLAMEKRR